MKGLSERQNNKSLKWQTDKQKDESKTKVELKINKRKPWANFKKQDWFHGPYGSCINCNVEGSAYNDGTKEGSMCHYYKCQKIQLKLLKN